MRKFALGARRPAGPVIHRCPVATVGTGTAAVIREF
jgi:hypothetical protein